MPGTGSNIAARLDRLPMSRSLWRLVLLISLGAAFELYDIFLSTYITPGLTASGMFTTTPGAGAAGFFALNSVGFFISCNFAGMFVGCVGFGYVADRLGRRSIFIFSLLWYSICTAIMAFQNTATGVDLWRFVAGIGVGLEQVTIDTFLPEIVPPASRGRAFAFYQFVEFCAVPIVALLGWLLVPLHPLGLDGWRWVALVGALGAIVVWWLRRGIPESPRWLAAHGRQQEAEQLLDQFEAWAVADTGSPLPVLEAAASPAPASGRGEFGELLRPPYLRRTVVLSVFNLMQTVAFYGFGSWVPTLLIAKGILVTTSQMYAFIIAIANPIGPLLGMLVADRMERKWQIVSAGVLIGVFATLFANQANAALVIAFGVAVTLSNNWMSFAFHNYQGELFPTRVRARAVGFVYSWSRVSATFASLMINFLLIRGGAPAVAAFIAAAMVVMTLTIGGFGPKTRRLTLEEISQ